VAAAFDVIVVSFFTETRERSPLLLASAPAAGHAATLAESRKTSAFVNREADIHELLRMNDGAPWERSFQFGPFAVDVFGSYGDGATAILQQLTRKSSEHNSMTVDACKLLAFQSSMSLRRSRTRGRCDRRTLQSPVFPSSLKNRTRELV
jgi:hypothetical protein